MEITMSEDRARQHRAEYDSSLRNADGCAERAMAIEEPTQSAALAIVALTYATMAQAAATAVAAETAKAQ
jgi:hypothetical protein